MAVLVTRAEICILRERLKQLDAADAAQNVA
jgi:hypothetical protein